MSCTVYQYFGEKLTNTGWEFYYTNPDNITYENFDCAALTTSLNSGGGTQLSFNTFTLTEKELLASVNLNTWLAYCAKRYEAADRDLLGIKLMNQLMGGFNQFIADTTNFFNTLLDGDTTGVTAALAKNTDYTIRAKLEIAREWLAKLYSTYYGRQYLIQVGSSSTGVCIKDRYGNAPSGNVKVESEGGIFYSSDTPSTAGGWLARNQNNIMGLSVGTELYPFTDSDSRIGTFVQYIQGSTIDKFGLKWDIDLSSLGDGGNWYRKGNSLYVKANVDPALYKIGSNQYVLVTIDGEANLIYNKDSVTACPSIADARGAQSILLLHGGTYETTLMDTQSCNQARAAQKSGISLDHHNINTFDYHKPIICPDNFCIPFKSNIFTYGPWFFQANPVGGTEVEPNKELAPWNFSNLQNNGYAMMNYYGALTASDGPRGLQKQESGSITVASLPSYSIGYIIGGNAATLTDLQINIGDNGYTTTYNFQTYTPKFGKPGRYLNDLWKNNYKSMSHLNKYFKDQALEIRSLINNLQQQIQKEGLKAPKNLSTATGVVTQKPKGTNSSNTPHMILYSAYTIRSQQTNNGGGTDSFDNSTGVEAPCYACKNETPPPGNPLIPSSSTGGNNIKNIPMSITEESLENTWFKQHPEYFIRMAFNSLDLIFSPISTKQQNDPNAELPRLAMYQDYNANFMEFSNKTETRLGDGKAPNSRPRSEIPPFLLDDILQYDLPIHQMYLNGVTSTVMLSEWLNRINGSTAGFVTSLISHGSDAKNFSLIQDTNAENDRQDADNFRYSVLRGPLSLQSWGYDTSGKPIPNAIDSAYQAERGKFRRRGLQDKFLKNWLSNPKTWPAGPIDLRWDRERGVWVAPPSNKIVVARLLTNLERFGVAEAELVDPIAGGIRFYEEYDLWSDNGANIKQSMNKTKIKVYDFLGVNLCKCDYVYAYYDDNRYIVLESSRAYKNPNEGCCVVATTTKTPETDISTLSLPTPTSCWSNLEHLKSLPNYRAGKHQALVHKSETQGPDCLHWEDIVECYTPPP